MITVTVNERERCIRGKCAACGCLIDGDGGCYASEDISEDIMKTIPTIVCKNCQPGKNGKNQSDRGGA